MYSWRFLDEVQEGYPGGNYISQNTLLTPFANNLEHTIS